jgi:hypothetical protein
VPEIIVKTTAITAVIGSELCTQTLICAQANSKITVETHQFYPSFHCMHEILSMESGFSYRVYVKYKCLLTLHIVFCSHTHFGMKSMLLAFVIYVLYLFVQVLCTDC